MQSQAVTSVVLAMSRARELYEVFSSNADPSTMTLSASQVRSTFHQLQLFPSQSQVVEMVTYASECNGRRRADHLRFSEFCVLVTEMRQGYLLDEKPHYPVSLRSKKMLVQLANKRSSRKLSGKAGKFRVFLGGSCNPTTWREDFAIPYLKKQCITFYNPQVLNWRPELMQIEDQAKQSAELLFFVIDNQTRSTASMVEAAYLAGAGRKLILTVRDFQGEVIINNERLSKREVIKLRRMHVDLIDIIEQSKIPVFGDIKNALKCTAKIINQEIEISKLRLEDGVFPIMHPDLPSGRCLLDLHSSYENVIGKNKKFLELSDLELAFKSLTNDGSIASKLNLSSDRKYELHDFYVIFSEYLNDKAQRNTATHWKIVVALISALRNLLVFPKSDEEVSNNNDNSRFEIDEMPRRDIYLGGTTCSKWREEISIPILRKRGISFHSETQLTASSRNVSTSSIDSGFCCNVYDDEDEDEEEEDEIEEEDVRMSEISADPFSSRTAPPPHQPHHRTRHHQRQDEFEDGTFGSADSRHLKPKLMRARNKCKVLLYVIGSDDTGMNSMIEAGNYIGKGCNIVLCVNYLSEDAIIDNEKLTPTAVKDYNRARDYLCDIANRDGFPVFTDVAEATEFAINRVKGGQ